MFRAAHVAGLVLLALLATACDKVPLFAPSRSTITLTAGQRILALNSSVEITAVVIEPSGTPVQNGTTVRFTTSLGRLDPVEVETRNGIATTTLYAGDTSGVADVRAFSGTAGSTSSAANGEAATTPTNTLSFSIGTAAADTVTISTKPSSVPATGGSVEVNAVVRAANGQGLAGVPVTFSATRGTLTNTVATTDANGVATVGLSTSVETSVTAVSGSKTAATPATVAVLGAPSVTLTCQGSGNSGLTSCSQTSGQAFTFTAAKATSSTALVDAYLDFDDGNRTNLGTLSSSVTVTKTYNSVNPYTVTLVATDINGQVTRAAVAVNVTAVTPRTPLSVNFTTVTVGTERSTGTSVAFTATATAETGVLIESYTWDFGDGIQIQTSGNQTSHVYGSSSNPAPNSTTFTTYTVTVTVRTADGRTGTARTQIQVKLGV